MLTTPSFRLWFVHSFCMLATIVQCQAQGPLSASMLGHGAGHQGESRSAVSGTHANQGMEERNPLL
jgi:hypothetical protein